MYTDIHSPQVSFHTSVNDGDAKVILAPEHEDTAELQPPPVPPKKIDTK